MRGLIAIFALLLVGPGAAQSRSGGGPMTRKQGDEILAQLRAIRQLLLRGLPQPEQRAGSIARPVGEEHVSFVLPTGTPAVGSPNAPAAMVEFTDLQCPNCREFQAATFPTIASRFIRPGTLRFFSLDLPLAQHPYAMRAALEERCAGAAGKFWPFRDALLAAPHLTPAILSVTAERLGLAPAQLAACASSPALHAAILADRRLALAAGIYGTPGFVVGTLIGGRIAGQRILGARPFTVFRAAILAVARTRRL